MLRLLLVAILVFAAPALPRAEPEHRCVETEAKISEWKEHGFSHEVISGAARIARATEFLALHDIAIPADTAVIMIVWFGPLAEIDIVQGIYVCQPIIASDQFGTFLSQYVTLPPPDPVPVGDPA